MCRLLLDEPQVRMMNLRDPLHPVRLCRITSPVIVTLVLLAASNVVGQQASFEQQRQAAIALEQQGKNSEAEVAWRAVLAAQPNSAEAYAHIGFLEARQERYPQAIREYKKALVL